MKLVSSSDYETLESDFVIMVGTTKELEDFPKATNEVTFCFNELELMRIGATRIVFINPADLGFIRNNIPKISNDDMRCEVWIRRDHVQSSFSILTENEDIGIHGIHVSDAWLCLLIGPAELRSRDCKDLALGISIPHQVAIAHNEKSNEVVTTNVNWRSMLVAQVIPIAKPFKKYLPTRMVILLYKLLDKIR